jgi:S-adenosylmethionine/arginine decarboxylase-like enzyme
MPFGYTLMLDLYDCAPGVADDMELTYRFLEKLVDRLNMTKMSAPIVIHGPRYNGVEEYPDREGVSGWVPLIESGIQIHSIEPKHFITIDIYSCCWFDERVVEQFAKETFGAGRVERNFVPRGTDY